MGKLGRSTWRDQPRVLRDAEAQRCAPPPPDPALLCADGPPHRLQPKEIKCQEAIFELIETEEAFAGHIHALCEHYFYPMQNESARLSQSGIQIYVRKMEATTRVVAKNSSAFVSDLKRVQDKAAVVREISSVFNSWTDTVASGLHDYIDHVMMAMDLLNNPDEKLAQLIAAGDAKAGSLNLNARVLMPVQRLMRYVIVIDEITKNITDAELERCDVATADGWRRERTELQRLSKQLQKYNSVCDQRIGEMHAWHLLKDLDSTLQFDSSKLPGFRPVWTSQLRIGERVVKKRGLVQLFQMASGSSGKVGKKTIVELMLFSDIFQYAKPMKVKKTGDTKYKVFEQVHRSLIQVCRASGKGDDVLQIDVLPLPDQVSSGATVRTLFARMTPGEEIEQWLDEFNPVQEDGEYQLWDCPRAKVVQNYCPGASETAELPLQIGQVVMIDKRNKNVCKGRIVVTEAFPAFKTSGWFPTSCVEEEHTERKEAKEVRRHLGR